MVRDILITAFCIGRCRLHRPNSLFDTSVMALIVNNIYKSPHITWYMNDYNSIALGVYCFKWWMESFTVFICFWTEAEYIGMLWNFRVRWCVLLSFCGVINSCFCLRRPGFKDTFNWYTNSIDFYRSLFLWATIANNERSSVKYFPEE